MNEELISAFQKDMKISRYNAEPQQNFFGRLLYSAMSHWLRYTILDQGNEDDEKLGRSKKYILARGTEILNNFLLAVPEAKNWFLGKYLKDKNDEIQPAHIIRERMLNSGELIETDFQSYISFPANKSIAISNMYNRIIGLQENLALSAKTVGLTRIVQNKNDGFQLFIDIPTAKEYVQTMIKNAVWHKNSDESSLEFFLVRSQNSPYKSWSYNLPESGIITLGRLHLFNGLYEYCLVRNDAGRLYTYTIPETLTKYKENRRVILGLRSIYKNDMWANAIRRGNIYILTLLCRLPVYEENIIETYCWPLNDIMDQTHYVVPEELWDYIKAILANLNIRTE